MPRRERSVLHVLPHAGGGGETYVAVLGAMPGYSFARVDLAPSRKPRLEQVARGVAGVWRQAWAHDLVHVHGEAATHLLLPLIAVRPSVVTLHGLHLLRRSSGVKHRVAAVSLRMALSAADRTICVSHAECAELAAAVGRRAVGRTVVIHNGAASPTESTDDRTAVRRELGLAADEPLAIWVGALDERRDPVGAVRAAERTGTTLLVVGDGPLRPDVERAAGSHARVLGQRDDVPRLLAASDVFLLLSHREGLSFALVEAMAHGLPLLAADVPENVEAVGDAGITVPYGDEEAVAAALRRLVDVDGERALLGERARRRARDLFSAEQMIDRTRALYDEVLAERKP